MAPRPVLVVGATGGVGQWVVRKLLERGELVHALVRPKSLSRARELLGDDPIYMDGDARERAGLERAFYGAASVICCIGSREPVGENSPQSVDYEGLVNMVGTAVGVKQEARALLEQFVLVSSIAVTHPDHPLNQFGQVLDWKRKGEEALRTSGLTYTIIRPGRLTDDPGGQQAILIDQGDRITGSISRADVAELCIQSLDEPNTFGTTFEAVNAPGEPPADYRDLFRRLASDSP